MQRGIRIRGGQESEEELESGTAFHSFYTSVEMVSGFYFVHTYDDDSYASWARTRNDELLG